MAGVTATLTTIGLDEAIKALSGLADFQVAELADDAGALLESSTRGRFSTGIAPDGSAWPAWSDAYAATRGGHHSLLVAEGDLRDTIASYATGSEAIVGTNLVYAAHHQFGSEGDGGIPARPYLGISPEDERDLRDLITGRLADLVQ